VLPPVRGHQQLRSVRGYVVGNFGVGWCDLHRHGEVERVDDRVSGDGDIGGVDPFGEQVVARARGRSEMEARDLAREFPVRLFGEWAGDIARAQARLEVDDW